MSQSFHTGFTAAPKPGKNAWLPKHVAPGQQQIVLVRTDVILRALNDPGQL
jgi:hypothetical protein